MRVGFVASCLVAASLCACIRTPSRNAPMAAAGEARVTEDVIYGHKLGLAMVFNVFRPREPNGLGVIFINSGGWQSPFEGFVTDDGDGRRLMTRAEIDRRSPLWGEFSPQPLLDRGYTVFEVRHGSSPRFVIPEIVADLRRAVRFIRVHASEYQVDPERLGLWGGSAGGHLALMLGVASENGKPGAADPVESASGRVAAVVAYFPPSDLTTFATPERVREFPALNFDSKRYPDYSPIRFASSDDPPTLIVHGDRDSEVPIEQGRSMHKALASAGASTAFIVIEGAGHGFQASNADRAAAEMVSWFERHLRGR